MTQKAAATPTTAPAPATAVPAAVRTSRPPAGDPDRDEHQGGDEPAH
jgi:hypothetical protein